MTYCPYVTDKKNKPITFEGGGKAIIRRFSKGDYNRFQIGLSKISRVLDAQKKAKAKADVKKTKEKFTDEQDMTAWEMQRNLAVEIGVVSWNFVDEKGDPLSTTGYDDDKFDGDVFNRIRDEIIKHNPCLWPHVSENDLKRMGIEAEAKNA